MCRPDDEGNGNVGQARRGWAWTCAASVVEKGAKRPAAASQRRELVARPLAHADRPERLVGER